METRKQKLKLRGHHISLLADFLANHIRWNGERYNPEMQTSYTKLYNGLNKPKLSKEYDLQGYDLLDDFRGKDYATFCRETSPELFRVIVTSPESGFDIPIEIVSGRDTICGLCPAKCEGIDESGKEDEETVKEFGLEKGRIYTAKELLNIIKAWQDKNGEGSPRSRGMMRYSLKSYHTI